MSCLRYEISSGGLEFHQPAGSSLHLPWRSTYFNPCFLSLIEFFGVGFGADS